ncbi:hypothetical protein B0H14DRAFT_2605499 [Mycena olivaceomarginata]|nr:hypothetical protein B0H14DRAFT_2605499 [Mycena olivaceomarginata]
MTVLRNPLQTRVIVTGVGKRFYVPPHWHAVHDEIHVVLKGRVVVTQDGVRHVVGPEDGACLTRRGVIHSLESCSLWRRLRRRLRMFSTMGIHTPIPTGLRWLERPVIVALSGYIAVFWVPSTR